MKTEYRKTCPECGEPFTTDRSIKIYCSKKCMNRAYARSHRERMREACRKYQAKTRERRLAWQRDYQRSNYIQRRQNDHSQTVCPECGATFTPAHGNKCYCSDACMVRARNRRKRERAASVRQIHEHVKTCKWCGKEFKTAKSIQVYCSPECCRKGSDNAYHASERRKAKTNTSGLTDVQKRTVEHDMCLPSDQRRKMSSKWTDAMRRYAMKIYMYHHGLFRRTEYSAFN